ncbi:MAG TPA: type II toxin-antitoxin system prevent-host-death family antitoxin [Bryobacteraceae bacterium]|jgi:prevent-host-death family protein|nr:type II toxin-antitoxin system prevent-host-death family antitoxin [Bryobacteraceae bacterium]
MKATIVTIHEAKTNLSGLIRQVSDGEEVIIARGTQPVAPLVAIVGGRNKRVPGSLKGKLSVGKELRTRRTPFW